MHVSVPVVGAGVLSPLPRPSRTPTQTQADDFHSQLKLCPFPRGQATECPTVGMSLTSGGPGLNVFLKGAAGR